MSFRLQGRVCERDVLFIPTLPKFDLNCAVDVDPRCW